MDDSEKTKICRIEDIQAEQEGTGLSPFLIVLAGRSVGRMHRIIEGEMVIGRDDQATIRMDDDGVSRRHAQLICKLDGTVAIVDLGSTNGTWVEGQRVTYHELKDGERIQIGSANILKYGYQDAVEEQFVSQMYESATQDGLTGVYNKRFFIERLEQEFAYHQRHAVPMAIIMIDIDHFKQVNDNYGHPTGDFILRKLSELCAQQCRTEDVFARYGGEEFAVILRQSTRQDAIEMAERIRKVVESVKFEYAGPDGPVSIRVTISAGVSEQSGNIPSPEALIEIADQNLYKAKEAGRNRVCAAL